MDTTIFYFGGFIMNTSEVLDTLYEVEEVPDLKNVIYDLPEEDVEIILMGGDIEEKRIGELRGYQTCAVAFMYYAKNCLLGDSVGMGKTVEVSGLCNLLWAENNDFKYLLLTEKRVAPQVRKEMIRFTGKYTHLVPSAEAKNLDEWWGRVDVESTVGTHALISSDRFLSWLEMYRQEYGEDAFDTLFIDESGVLGGKTKNEIVRSFKVMSRYFKRIVFMNATPVESHCLSFYNQLKLLDKHCVPTKDYFLKRYCVMKYNYNRGYSTPTNKYKNVEEFRDSIRHVYWASTRKEQGGVMVDCHGEILLSDLSPIQKSLLNLTQMKRMVYDCPTTIDERVVFNEKNVPKLGSLLAVLDESGDEQVIIFCQYKEAQHYLSEWLWNEGYSNNVMNGSTSNKDGVEIIDNFRNGDFRVLITNVQKGLNFPSCNYCVFWSLGGNPSEAVQFEGRIMRDFDIIGKNVYILASRGKEYSNIVSVAKDRANGMSTLSQADYSLVMSILKDA